MKFATRVGFATVLLGATLLSGCKAQATPPATPTVVSTPAARATPALSTPTQRPSATLTQPSSSTVAPTTAASTAPTEQPAPAETSPAGDIPDTQTFVSFRSATGGYTLDVPEGWARTTSNADLRFVDKLDGVQVTLADAAAAPTASSARASELAALTKAGRAVQVARVQDVRLPAGPAVFVEYSANSEPDAVTGKQVRLENNAYLFFRNGKLATLTLWAPLGADNVDQWQRIAQSFRWQ